MEHGERVIVWRRDRGEARIARPIKKGARRSSSAWGRLRPHRDYVAVARRATAANEGASWMAISERTLRSRPMAAFFSPLTRRE